MITHFRIQNFKILEDVSISPGPVNVLIGPNGCGKSSLLQAINFLKAFFSPSVDSFLQQQDQAYRDLPNVLAGSKAIHWEVECEVEGDEAGSFAGVYKYSVSLSPKRYLGVGREQLDFTPTQGQTTTLLRRTGRVVQLVGRNGNEPERLIIPNLTAGAVYAFSYDSRGRRQYPAMWHFVRWVRRIKYFEGWNPETLRTPDRGKFMYLGPTGEHLAPILANLKSAEPESFRKLLSRLQKLFPNLVDISFSGRGWGWRAIRLHEIKGKKTFILNNRQISDGFLRLLAITSFLYLDRTPSIAMFEEPENGVHPHILREMVQVLRELTLKKSANRPQILFTTHSPYVLDEFYEHPDEVWVMDAAGGKSTTQLVRLTERAQIDKVKKSFATLGEAWFSDAIGGNPSNLLF
jgi:predicted ATPase